MATDLSAAAKPKRKRNATQQAMDLINQAFAEAESPQGGVVGSICMLSAAPGDPPARVTRPLPDGVEEHLAHLRVPLEGLGSDIPGLVLPHPYVSVLDCVPSWMHLTRGKADVAYQPLERREPGWYPYLPFDYPDAPFRDGHHVQLRRLPAGYTLHATD